LRGANSPRLAACWFGVIKAGGIAVGTMPLLRARDLEPIVDKARIAHALCDASLAEEIDRLRASRPVLVDVLFFNGDADGGGGAAGRPELSLEARAAGKPASFTNLDTAADDTCLIAFTSGTTGVPKGTMHFHRDVIAACRCWPPHVLRANCDD